MVAMLFDRGLLGIACFALAWVCWRLFKMYSESVEKRATESKEVTTTVVEAINTNTASMNALADLIKDRRPG